MAEFQEVMRQFDRMCKAHAGCINCQLHHEGCSVEAFVDKPAEIEQKVMSWAEEHPEPVYPTWVEWLYSQGLMTDVIDGKGGNFLYNLASEPIPANIAKKLDIEPKETEP